MKECSYISKPHSSLFICMLISYAYVQYKYTKLWMYLNDFLLKHFFIKDFFNHFFVKNKFIERFIFKKLKRIFIAFKQKRVIIISRC